MSTICITTPPPPLDNYQGNPHWLIEPTFAIRGAEDLYIGKNDFKKTNILWEQGFNDAIKGTTVVAQINPKDDIVLVLNCAFCRY